MQQPIPIFLVSFGSLHKRAFVQVWLEKGALLQPLRLGKVIGAM